MVKAGTVAGAQRRKSGPQPNLNQPTIPLNPSRHQLQRELLHHHSMPPACRLLNEPQCRRHGEAIASYKLVSSRQHA